MSPLPELLPLPTPFCLTLARFGVFGLDEGDLVLMGVSLGMLTI